ncbi:uncharacterized protein LOC130801318 [Amaranthus tricolor]|uniref:uncharacterized protein LOC130801318 n=1 Tax=Amaranthus tricolor TaxID=29722 RepID=UPI00258C63DA|nr:uncharacterized protein LOC130801318 [Amaranthus tricolor]
MDHKPQPQKTIQNLPKIHQQNISESNLDLGLGPNLSLNINPKQNIKNLNTKSTITNDNLNKKKPIWDCGSSLYDSFELNSFQKQLNSAIINSSRTFSMPRLPSEDHRAPPVTPSKKSKLSRSFQKLLKSVFRAHNKSSNTSKSTDHDQEYYDSSSPDPWYLDHDHDQDHYDHSIQEKDKGVENGRYFVVFEKPNGLSTIPEVPEVGLSPEIKSLVTKTMSDRFSFRPSNGIYCV